MIYPDWKPYPKNKPKQTGKYLVTVIPKWRTRVVTEGWYSKETFNKDWTFPITLCAGCSDEDVKAWTVLPQPYGE